MPRGIPKAGKRKTKAKTTAPVEKPEPVFKPPFSDETPDVPEVETAPPAHVKAIRKTSAICGNEHCRHAPEMHYGSEFDWCNTNKCRCQGWKN